MSVDFMNFVGLHEFRLVLKLYTPGAKEWDALKRFDNLDRSKSNGGVSQASSSSSDDDRSEWLGNVSLDGDEHVSHKHSHDGSQESRTRGQGIAGASTYEMYRCSWCGNAVLHKCGGCGNTR